MTQDKTLYFDELQEDFDNFMDDYDVNRRKELIFSILLAGRDLAGKKVLEVGCGTGKFSQEIAQRNADLTVLDIGPNLVESVSKRLHCDGVVGDACHLPFEENTFDFVISSECIEHTPDPLEAIARMARVCKQGGSVCLTTPNKLWYPVLWLSQKVKVRKFAGIENWVFPGQARKTLLDNDMGQVKTAGCHLWPFQLRFTRPLLTAIDRKAIFLYPLMINFGMTATKSSGRGE